MDILFHSPRPSHAMYAPAIDIYIRQFLSTPIPAVLLGSITTTKPNNTTLAFTFSQTTAITLLVLYFN